jgi:hypothetical protein
VKVCDSHSTYLTIEYQADKKLSAKHQVEEAMTDALVRKCTICGKPFLKEDGCNRMKCPCGHSQCYVCSAATPDYSHFDQRGNPDSCPLYGDMTDRLMTDVATAQEVTVKKVMQERADVNEEDLRVDKDIISLAQVPNAPADAEMTNAPAADGGLGQNPFLTADEMLGNLPPGPFQVAPAPTVPLPFAPAPFIPAPIPPQPRAAFPRPAPPPDIIPPPPNPAPAPLFPGWFAVLPQPPPPNAFPQPPAANPVNRIPQPSAQRDLLDIDFRPRPDAAPFPSFPNNLWKGDNAIPTPVKPTNNPFPIPQFQSADSPPSPIQRRNTESAKEKTPRSSGPFIPRHKTSKKSPSRSFLDILEPVQAVKPPIRVNGVDKPSTVVKRTITV